MNGTPARLLHLLSLLQTPREWPGSELAERLGVTDRTVRRDIDRLRELGYPVEATMGAAGGYRLVAGTAMPPLLVDDEEAVAIAVGLRMAAGSAIAGIEEASVRALTKLEQVLPKKLRRRVRVLGAATVAAGSDGSVVDPEVLVALAATVTNRERARFGYLSGSGAESRRNVEPVGLVCARRRWYLVCFDVDRQDWRTFRVNRISGVQATGARFVPRELPAANAAAFVGGARSDWGTKMVRVRVFIHAPVGQVAGRLGDREGDIVAVDDGICLLDGRRDDSMEWLAHRLIGLGVGFEVVGPGELIAELRKIRGRVDSAISGRGDNKNL
ncbi:MULTISPECIES: YafY family protein [unclassified Nocardia]|uniref:helix-turn-helix transcriptional regulator n=1 Tax=unclassified Nocardia TaxID=2637762 RepID=UPI001CE4420E|nr:MULTISPECIES: YafY family protein [unclassified Nocardia]